MAAAGGHVEAKQSEQVEGGEDNLRTVECLRGRLLAERAASRNAKEEAEHLGNKLIELEVRLKEETKSRNRAENRLKSLMKKLESLEIFYVSDQSEQSGFLDKSEISYAPSIASTSTKEAEEHKQVNGIPNVAIEDIQDLPSHYPPQNVSLVPDTNLNPENISKSTVSSPSSRNCVGPADPEIKTQKFETPESMEKTSYLPEQRPESPAVKETASRSPMEAQLAKTPIIEPSQNYQALNINDSHSFECSVKEILSEGHQEEDDYVDNSLALVAVDLLPKKQQAIDPAVLDATVKEALDALRHAKQKLQTSMERRRVIKVG